MMKKLLIALALFCAPAAAIGQQLGPGQVWGNSTAAPRNPRGEALSAIIDRAITSTRGSILFRGVAGWVGAAPGTSGFAWVSNGAGADPAYQVLPLVGGGTGSGTAGGARTNLGVAIGSNVEAWDSDLDCLAALASTGVVKRTGAGACSAGAVAISDLATGTQDTVIGYFGSTAASALSINNCANALTYSTATHTFGCNASTGTGTVMSVGSGNGLVGGPITSAGTLSIEQLNPGGRLTLASGVPVMTTDQAGATSIYYAPFAGKYVPIYNGTSMQLYPFTASDSDTVGLSIALGTNWAANTIYDVFIGLNSSTVTLCSGPAWTNSGAGTSARGSGAGTTQLALFKGLQTNAVSITCRFNNTTTFTCAANQCTYVGSFITNGSTGTIDFKFGSAASGGGAACLCVYNAYNQVSQRGTVQDSVSTYTYTTASYRQANASTGNQVNFLVGLAGGSITVMNSAQVFNSTGGVLAAAGIGIDSTTINSAQIQMAAQAPASTSASTTATYMGNPAPGFHYAARLEYSQVSGTTTWDGTAGVTGIQSGEVFLWQN